MGKANSSTSPLFADRLAFLQIGPDLVSDALVCHGASYNARMSRLIAFLLCIAFLFGAGGFVRTGMALAAASVMTLAGYLVWGLARMFIGPAR